MKRLIIFLLSTSFPLYAAEYMVKSVKEWNALKLSPGDEVVWANGSYADDDNINFSAKGDASNVITLRAETPGGVGFTGGMTMTISGDHVVVVGFHWRGGTGKNNHIQFRKGSVHANHSTLRNCAIDNLNDQGTDKHRWVVMYGKNNTVERCSFVNKQSPGALILVELDENQKTDPVGHQIKHNYFFNYVAREPKSRHSGDSETIRIGESSLQAKNASVTVAHNYFQACDGENEIITNKSSNNIYKYNTFRKCRGSLVLRHGANVWVEGNYFLGQNKKDTGGVRVSDSFHTIINNYFQDLNNEGSKWNNAITLVGGSDETGGSNNGYQKVDKILVAFNTVYRCDGPLFYNNRSSHDPTGMFAYNLLHSKSTDTVSGDIKGTGQGMKYMGNVVSGSDVGVSDSGFTLSDINFERRGETYRPKKVKSVLDLDALYLDKIKLDIDGRVRSHKSFEVGAHELTGAQGKAIHSPLTDDDVRAAVGASFIDATGALIKAR